VKLVELPGARLETAATNLGTEPLFTEEFTGGTGGWSVVSTPTDPTRQTEGALTHEVRSEGGESFLRLGGTRGLLIQLVPVDPATSYTFTGRIRSRDLEPAATPFYGATYYLAELHTAGTFEELAADGEFESRILKRHILPGALGEAEWSPRRAAFRTRPGTRMLLIGCALGTSEDVARGTVDFTDLRLERAPDAELWDIMARKACLQRSGETHTDWRSRRVLSADLRAELRPSIVLLPEERVHFALRLPGDAPLFEAGLGVWRPALVPGREPRAGLTVSIDGRQTVHEDIDARSESLENRWEQMTLDLSPHAGQDITLELAATGNVPIVVGAPCVRSKNPDDGRPNVILVSIDMLRADHVGAYGYEHGTTPNLDRMARENLFFPSMHAQASYTLPATVSMFSGQFPSAHGVYRGTQAVSPARSPLLAELLGAEGYATMGFTAGGFVSADFGLDAGFDGFTNVDPLRHPDSEFFHLLRNRNPELTKELVAEHGPARVAAWLDEHRDQRFFLFLHTYTVHDYDAPEGWLPCEELGCKSSRTDYTNFLPHIESKEEISEADEQHLYHRYDGSLRYVDSLLGELFAQLEGLGLAENTVIAVTSDHGEEMFERGVIQHGKTLYEELTRIPLIMRVPGDGPRVIEEPVMTIDVAPTILGALGLPLDRRMQGLDVLDPDLGRRPVLGEIDDHFAHKYSLRDGEGFKLIHSPRTRDEVLFPGELEWELYSTEEDPGEKSNLTESRQERFEALKARLEGILRENRELGAQHGTVGESNLDATTQNELEALGYTGD